MARGDEYVNIQTRCYEERFGTVFGVLKIKTTNRENVLETYRQQEQIAKNAQTDSVAVYLINFTKGIFENSVLKSPLAVSTAKGDPYEKIMFESAQKRLNTEDCYKFISTFSLGNVMKIYQEGQTELALEYEMFLANQSSIWMKSLLRLYTDKSDDNLKGYLYVLDIDSAKRREIELLSKVETDPLTGLYNKKLVECKISEKLLSVSSINQAAFFMIDLDHFKSINDTYGHIEGDRVIKETADCLLQLSCPAKSPVSPAVSALCPVPDRISHSQKYIKKLTLHFTRGKKEGRNGYTIYQDTSDIP